MIDLEKLSKGLDCLITNEVPCNGCPYYGSGYCMKNIAADARALVREQEPRVMDADEIVLSAEPSKWLWVERKGDYCAEAYKAGKTVSGLIAFECETPCAFLYCERPDEYGNTWRCWTSRPTEEQREATPWETQKEG